MCTHYLCTYFGLNLLLLYFVFNLFHHSIGSPSFGWHPLDTFNHCRVFHHNIGSSVIWLKFLRYIQLLWGVLSRIGSPYFGWRPLDTFNHCRVFLHSIGSPSFGWRPLDIFNHYGVFCFPWSFSYFLMPQDLTVVSAIPLALSSRNSQSLRTIVSSLFCFAFSCSDTDSDWCDIWRKRFIWLTQYFTEGSQGKTWRQKPSVRNWRVATEEWRSLGWSFGLQKTESGGSQYLALLCGLCISFCL